MFCDLSSSTVLSVTCNLMYLSTNKVSKTSYIFLSSPCSSVKGVKSNFKCEEEICSFCYCTSGYLGPSANADYIGMYLRNVAYLHVHSSLWTGAGSEHTGGRRA